ncbi:MAG: preprotein translocase subunit SecE [Candidatus Gracilibacteria bacterium]|nr:preprotein translocase subunit SecE [Candidatus Gracilibacteria bacterium]
MNLKENAITRYIKGSIEEIGKVTWPTKNQAVKLTIIVFIFVLIATIALTFVDFGFNEIYNYILKLNI